MQIENLAADAETFTANAFLVDNTTLVDAGADPVVLEQLAERDVEIETVVVTHSHPDHIKNLASIVDRYDPAVYAFEPGNLPVRAEKLADGDTVHLGALDTPFLTLHTPGHKDDSICLYSPNERVLFSGDLVFPDGVFGRTDLEGGDRDVLIDSIERIVDLDVQALYAGHGDPTTQDVNEQIRKSLEEAQKREAKYDGK